MVAKGCVRWFCYPLPPHRRLASAQTHQATVACWPGSRAELRPLAHQRRFSNGAPHRYAASTLSLATSRLPLVGNRSARPPNRENWTESREAPPQDALPIRPRLAVVPPHPAQQLQHGHVLSGRPGFPPGNRCSPGRARFIFWTISTARADGGTRCSHFAARWNCPNLGLHLFRPRADDFACASRGEDREL